MSTKVAINGFGRIGRLFFRTAYKTPGIEIAAINDITDPRTLAHLLKYDSIFGIFPEDVSHGDGFIQVGAKKIKVSAIKNPLELPWKELGIDLVVESTGLFTKRPEAEKHLQAGAKKVLISAPATDPDVTIVLGVNDGDYAAYIKGVALGEQRQGSRRGCQGMADALFNEFWIMRHTCQEDSLAHEVHRAQLHLRFLKETFARERHAQQAGNLRGAFCRGNRHAQRDKVSG